MTPMPAKTEIPVALPGRAYVVHVGAGVLGDVGALVKATTRARKVAVVTDRHVAPLYLAAVEDRLRSAGLTVSALSLAPGEQTKSFAVLEQVLDFLLAGEIERNDVVLALGGGVIGDLAGFAASILRRGVGFVQCPTTLLSQVDSSVGGKTAIDTRHGKNLVGAFYQPNLVIADLATLETLPARELKAGYAEVAKYGLIGDAPFFQWCEANGAALLKGDITARHYAVSKSVEAKAKIVVSDERESGERALLNLGHTFGHAFEAATGYGARLLHGEAIAIGMCLAFALSADLELAPTDDAKRVAAHFSSVGLPTRICDIEGPALTLDQILAHMMHDKKRIEGVLTLVLAHGIGKAFLTRDVPIEKLRAFLSSALKASR